ncbi:MAG TPA: cobyric acid synthase [Victivallales bacterium]|nr:cobyric acid synthase [Victivallales bacterium]
MKFEHGGNISKLAEEAGCKPDDIIDFSSSINPLGPPEFIRPLVNGIIDKITSYPDPRCDKLVGALSDKFHLPKNCISIGNGSTQHIFAIPNALGKKKALITTPSYIDYEKSSFNANLEIKFVNCKEENNFVPTKGDISAEIESDMLVFIGHPANPSGTAIPKNKLLDIIQSFPDSYFVIDEAFADFSTNDISLLSNIPNNTIILKSLTKFFAIPGIRSGLCFSSPSIIEKINTQIPDWSVNTIAQEVTLKLLNDCEQYADKTINEVNRLKHILLKNLSAINNLKIYPGIANYVLIKQVKPVKGFYEQLLKKYHIAVRNCSNFKNLGEEYFRISIKSETENELLVAAIKDIFYEYSSKQSFFLKKKKRKPSLMIQGTCSNAGKSILTAAICRILLQDGYSVAPFKSQNMALNSYVTQNGEEMGRAQVVQAEACRLDPDVRMNPILLKPSSDTGAQVIYMGKPIGNMGVPKYFNAKRELFGKVKKVYDSLEKDYECIVLEGAGSPGEMNLKNSDIVNMNMAQYAESPVLLAGDIDRGGVYASFIGTVATFEKWERDLLKGFIVNKFRGDPTLLKSAHDYVENYTGKPVLGVIPYVHDVGLPEEDSVSFSFIDKPKKSDKTIDIALISLKHIANFTDFSPFEIEPDINIRKVKSPKELGSPDVIILPGSKNVISDLEDIYNNGLANLIKEKISKGTWLIGICGGLQMAGETIDDPLSIESNKKTIKGLGLLPINTNLGKTKQLSITRGKLIKNSREVSGYEIHHGKSYCKTEKLISVVNECNEPVGFADGKIWLTYLHGVFEEDKFRREFIDMIRIDKNLPPLEKVQSTYCTEDSLNRLADIVRKNLDMKQIYSIMGFK